MSAATSSTPSLPLPLIQRRRDRRKAEDRQITDRHAPQPCTMCPLIVGSEQIGPCDRMPVRMVRPQLVRSPGSEISVFESDSEDSGIVARKWIPPAIARRFRKKPSRSISETKDTKPDFARSQPYRVQLSAPTTRQIFKLHNEHTEDLLVYEVCRNSSVILAGSIGPLLNEFVKLDSVIEGQVPTTRFIASNLCR